MSRKDYVLIAGILKDCRALGYNYDTLNLVCVSFAKRLKAENDAFDTERFLQACGCTQ